MNALAHQRVRPMVAADLEQVLAWRNHPEIRRYMYTQHVISLEEHTRWFEKASLDAGRHLLVFEVESVPFGFVNIQQVVSGGIADWGFYVSPNAPKGIGRQLGHEALRYAFIQAKLHKVCGQTLAHNVRSVRFHQKQGFRQEGILREQHFDGNRYHDVICFGLLAREWQSKQ